MVSTWQKQMGRDQQDQSQLVCEGQGLLPNLVREPVQRSWCGIAGTLLISCFFNETSVDGLPQLGHHLECGQLWKSRSHQSDSKKPDSDLMILALEVIRLYFLFCFLTFKWPPAPLLTIISVWWFQVEKSIRCNFSYFFYLFFKAGETTVIWFYYLEYCSFSFCL